MLFVDAIVQVIEDVRRHTADKEANGRFTQAYDVSTLTFNKVRWDQLKVGDIVR